MQAEGTLVEKLSAKAASFAQNMADVSVNEKNGVLTRVGAAAVGAVAGLLDPGHIKVTAAVVSVGAVALVAAPAIVAAVTPTTAAAGGSAVAAAASPAARNVINASTSMLKAASDAAFKAAAQVDQLAVGAKHQAGAGGNWSRFAQNVDPNGALRQALTSPNAQFLPHDARGFNVQTNLGSVVGSAGQTAIRAGVTFAGEVRTWFPVAASTP